MTYFIVGIIIILIGMALAFVSYCLDEYGNRFFSYTLEGFVVGLILMVAGAITSFVSVASMVWYLIK